MEGETTAVKGKAKLLSFRRIEQQMQSQWLNQHIFESDAQTTKEKPTFLVTFPYPYMNGRLHLGHSFSLSKCEFISGYKRLRGFHCLWPFGLHCTGMPIKACADKLKRELEEFGYPPKFPDDNVSEEKKEQSSTTAEAPQQPQTLTAEQQLAAKQKAHGKKSKAKAKTGSAKYQWNIMRSLGMKDEEIRDFVDTGHWLSYFPPLARSDLESMGVRVDWRRSFITTDANPYYDSFVRWQLTRLRERGHVLFGKRYTIYSPLDGQPCMDHDRTSGETVAPQEYSLIKLELLQPFPASLSHLKDKKVFLGAATLRPETMFGQTNCWVSPDIKYVAFETADGELLITTRRAARNMAHQQITKRWGAVDVVAEVPGSELMGCALKAPLARYERVYALPMFTIKENKGTGIVTSVPSDSPDDYAALSDLKKKKALREKFHISDDKVLPFEPVPIINIPEFGDLAAKKVCEDLKIQSQNEADKLKLAKEKVYLKGFYEGVFIIEGPFKGQRVQDAKKAIANQMISNKEAFLYMEPEGEVVSRSGDECVVALCDQWYLNYGDDQWKKQVREHVSTASKSFECFSDEVRNYFDSALSWLHEQACSRSYGLGTRLPWDPQYLIESLSDSTIYMSYYTVAHLLHTDVYGQKAGPLGISPQQLTMDVWDYIFAQAGIEYKPELGIPKDKLDQLRREFQYWYPVDLRCSGKDLIPNHLLFFLFNHVAIWPQDKSKWPRGVFANGHLLLNSEKMSKSTGNFLTLYDAVNKFSADGMRLALADAGDSMEDANFDEKVANAGLLRLYTFLEWVRDGVLGDCAVKKEELRETERDGPPNSLHDRIFEAEIDRAITDSSQLYERMLFKEALRVVFFEFQAARDRYREFSQFSGGMHRSLVIRFIEVQCLLLSPICPHVCDYIWSELLKKPTSILTASWPESRPVDRSLLAVSMYLDKSIHAFRLRQKAFSQAKSKGGKQDASSEPSVRRATHAALFIAEGLPPWQAAILGILKQMHSTNSVLPENKEIMEKIKDNNEIKKYMKQAMPYVQLIKDKLKAQGPRVLEADLEFNEKEVLQLNLSYITSALDLERVELAVYKEGDELATKYGVSKKAGEDIKPSEPLIVLRVEESIPLRFVNRQSCNGLFEMMVPVFVGDLTSNLQSRLKRREKGLRTKRLRVLYYKDVRSGPRRIPNVNDPLAGLEELPDGTRIVWRPASAENAVASPSASGFEVFGALNENGNEVHLGEQLVYYVG